MTNLVIGLGELGTTFAVGMLRAGISVVPVRREDNLQEIYTQHPAPHSVWICVAEKDINQILSTLPKTWKSRCVLIQNELLPNDWLQHDIQQPTVISVWFEKKAGKQAKVVQPSVVFGPQSEQVKDIFNRLLLPIKMVDTENNLRFELVLKNLYIQTTNIAGLAVGGDTQTLVEQHPELMQSVAKEVISLQQAITGCTFDTATLMQAFITACYGDPQHQCMGRSAPARLKRALVQAEQFAIQCPTIQDIAAKIST